MVLFYIRWPGGKTFLARKKKWGGFAFRVAKIRDACQFFALLTPLRLWNGFLLLSSYYLSRLLSKPLHWGQPMALAMEPTTACNLRCPECPSGLRAFTRATGKLDVENFRAWLPQLSRHALTLTLYFQGEPFIHPHFFKLVQEARRRGLYTITSTNGHFLDEERARQVVESGLNRLVVSVDGATQEVYEQYRVGGKLQEVQDGVRRVVEWKRRLSSPHPHLIIQFLVLQPNEHQIGAMQSWAREVGADELRLKTAQLYDYQRGHPLMPSSERYARYRQQADGTYRLKYRLLNHCWRLWHAVVITWDGQVLPCCFDKDGKHAMGSLAKTSFRKIWRGKACRDFRQRILHGRSQIDICTNCTEGCRVWGK